MYDYSYHETIYRAQVLDGEYGHHGSELQPPVGDMGGTVYPEYNIWSVQRIAE